MGAGIAQVAAQAGHTVKLFDVQAGAAGKGRDGIDSQLAGRVAKGKIDEADKAAVIGRIAVATDLSELSDAALVIEAIVEDLAVKQALFADLEDICGEATILATNTSSLSVTRIASSLSRPQQFVGLHFFNPAPVMKLVEVVPGLATDPDVAECAFNTMTAWAKKPVMARNTPGFIVNRVARPFYAETLNLLEQQACNAVTADALMRECGGFRMGACQLTDLIGQDVNYKVTRTVFAAFDSDPRFRPSLVQQELVDAGHLGRKSGRGFYEYDSDAVSEEPSIIPPGPAPAALEIETRGMLLPLAERLEKAGISVSRREGSAETILGDGVHLALSDGRLATERAAEEAADNLVLFDLALDYASCLRIAIAPADPVGDDAIQTAAAVFQAAGMQVSQLDDVPALLVLRTVAMLANEGASAVNEGICSAAGVDDAMCFGVNYPRGPLAWADAVGNGFVLRVLQNLQAVYGDDRYRPSPRLRRMATTGSLFHAGATA